MPQQGPLINRGAAQLIQFRHADWQTTLAQFCAKLGSCITTGHTDFCLFTNDERKIISTDDALKYRPYSQTKYSQH
jgi:hypothetical protein